SAGTTPVMAFSRVDLPLPLGPMRPSTSPRPTVRSTASTARTPPDDTPMLRAVSTAPAGAGARSWTADPPPSPFAGGDPAGPPAAASDSEPGPAGGDATPAGSARADAPAAAWSAGPAADVSAVAG